MTRSTEKFCTRISYACALSTFVLVASVHAQTRPELRAYTTNQIEITFGSACTVPEGVKVRLILDDVDTEIETRRDGNRWIAVKAPRIDPYSATASVRFENTRTDCQPSHSSNGSIATFHFPWCVQGVQQVTIETTAPIDVSYVREFVTCRERKSFIGRYPVTHVALPDEQLRLQLGTKPPRLESLGLKVNPLLDVKGTRTQPKPLQRAGVVQALIVQRAKGDGSAPNFSTPAIDVDHRKLAKLKLERLKLTVE